MMNTICFAVRRTALIQGGVAATLIFAQCATRQGKATALLGLEPRKIEYRLHTPRDFAAIQAKSSIRYSIQARKDTQNLDKLLKGRRSFATSPYLRVNSASNGTVFLSLEPPAAPVARLMRAAEHILRKKDYVASARIYEKALSLDSAYFLSWINLGRAYGLMKDYANAERCFHRGLAINRVCLRGYRFLAEMYLEKGDSAQALENALRLYALNRHDSEEARVAIQIAQSCGLRLRSDRLSFPFEIKKTSQKTCVIVHANNEPFLWPTMANCLACWAMEPFFSRQYLETKQSLPMKYYMYKECVINQTMAIAAKKKAGQALHPQERLLLAAVADTCLDAILYWQIIAAQVPTATALLSPDGHDRIVKYLRRYVFEKNQRP